MEPFTKYSDWLMNYEAIQKLPQKQIVLFACDVARLVLSIYEQWWSNDDVPRIAVKTAELFVYGKATKKEFNKAKFYLVRAKNDANRKANIDNAYSDAASAAHSALSAYLSIANLACDAECTEYATNTVFYAGQANRNIYNIIQTIYHQTTPITIPTTPILQAIAYQIVTTRNFQEYNILLDNLEEVHNIQLERTTPLGLSHYVLYHLTNTH